MSFLMGHLKQGSFAFPCCACDSSILQLLENTYEDSLVLSPAVKLWGFFPQLHLDSDLMNPLRARQSNFCFTWPVGYFLASLVLIHQLWGRSVLLPDAEFKHGWKCLFGLAESFFSFESKIMTFIWLVEGLRPWCYSFPLLGEIALLAVFSPQRWKILGESIHPLWRRLKIDMISSGVN